jgi:hypothetical protein
METIIIGICDRIADNKDLILILATLFSLIFAKSAVAISKVNKDVLNDIADKNEKWTDQEKLDQAIDYFQTFFGAKIPFINLPVFDQVIHFIVQKVYETIHPKN